MSRLSIDKKNIEELFNKSYFLIPDYQRPYTWTEKECGKLWEDLFIFSFPQLNPDNFDDDRDEYFLGPIVVFKNEENGKTEIIDGQQRLISLTLLLRAFYEKYENLPDDDNNESTRKLIDKCIWKTDLFGKPNKDIVRITSDVVLDVQKNVFVDVLKSGVDKFKSVKNNKYIDNYSFFKNRISELLNQYPSLFPYFAVRIIKNCILLPIEADSQDTALRIFSTLNDRGTPLSDADIFKAQFYKYFSSIGKKKDFIDRWKNLEELCNKIFNSGNTSPMDELFLRYMFYLRALAGNKNTTTEGLRKFYEKDYYKILQSEETFDNLIDLANFWRDVSLQNSNRFDDRVLKCLFILNYAPNRVWTLITSVYYLVNRDKDGFLDDEEFYNFLFVVSAITLAYAFEKPGVSSLRTPFFAEMVNIAKHNSMTLSSVLSKTSNRSVLKRSIENYEFTNGRALTKAMLAWLLYVDKDQQLFSLDTKLEAEHIYAKKRNVFSPLSKSSNLECIGNKVFLEKKINISASAYSFQDKVKFYTGQMRNKSGKEIESTNVLELIKLSKKLVDFTEQDIEDRKNSIIRSFLDFVEKAKSVYSNSVIEEPLFNDGDESLLKNGDIVSHIKYGVGIVISLIEDKEFDIEFEDGITKKFVWNVLKNGIVSKV